MRWMLWWGNSYPCFFLGFGDSWVCEPASFSPSTPPGQPLQHCAGKLTYCSKQQEEGLVLLFWASGQTRSHSHHQSQLYCLAKWGTGPVLPFLCSPGQASCLLLMAMGGEHLSTFLSLMTPHGRHVGGGTGSALLFSHPLDQLTGTPATMISSILLSGWDTGPIVLSDSAGEGQD